MKLLIVHSIATSYYKNIVFNSLYKIFKEFKVVHFAETNKIRKWDIDLSGIRYPYRVLFKGNLKNVNFLTLAVRMKKILNEENPEIVYLGGYSNIAFWVGLIFGKIKKKPVIIEMNSNEFGIKRRNFFTEFLKRFFVKRCDLGITYGELSKRYLINLGLKPHRIVIKPNVTNNEWWSVRSIELRKQREMIIGLNGFRKNNFIYIGRFSKEKNLPFLLECFVEAKKNTGNDNWGLILVGDGKLKNKLKKLKENLKINDLFFVGFIQRDKLPEYYSVSDVLILPSLSEPWGMVINEAMASGLAVFASDRCGASAELIREGKNGFIFDPSDKGRMTELISDVMTGKINLKKMQEESRKIINGFSEDVAADKIVMAIKKLNEEKIQEN